MTGKGTITKNPQRRLKLLLSLQVVWVFIVCLLGGWWGYLVLKQADRIADLEREVGMASSLIELQFLKTQRMLFWESAFFFGFLLTSMIFFFRLYWRDLKRAKGIQAFFASVTHELRTPLTSIRLQAESIAEAAGDSRLAMRLLEDTQRLEAQVERTLELARVEGGGPVFTQPLNLRLLIERLLKSWNTHHSMTADVQNRLGDIEVMADVTAVQVILKNLLENSFRHSNADRLQIILESEKKGNEIVLHFKDNGKPLDAKHFEVEELGSLFQKGPNSQGAGVGLYLIRVLMERMDGSAEQYIQKTKGPEWGKKVIANKVQNNRPQNFSYGFIAWNNKHPFFKDRDVRLAMSHLINRELMNEKFRFGMSELATGPFGNKSTASSKKVKAVPFDPKKALELLQKNGWKLGPKGLTKTIDGKETVFEFTLVHPSQDFEKYFTVAKEDMKKLGITMNIKYLEWNSFLKLMDERNFDALSLAWQVNDLEPDPKQIWHSNAIPSPGHNFVSYSNPAVDKLIDELRGTMNEKKRATLLNRVHELIADDQPYSFLFNAKFNFYGNTTRIKKVKDTLKYDLGLQTWSLAPSN